MESESSVGHNQRRVLLEKLPLLLNSSLDSRRVVEQALGYLKRELCAEAATIFLLQPEANELQFWALSGDEIELKGQEIPLGKGIVGWVLEHRQGLLVTDVKKDKRFFSEVDAVSGFSTRDVICVPLVARGSEQLGAVEILNSTGTKQFTEEDLAFLECVAHQLSLAIDNARLFEELKQRNNNLELLNRRKNEMISVIAHEFRTPLSLIQGAAEIITQKRANNNEETLARVSGTLQRGVGRLIKLISEIRNISSSESGHMPVAWEEIQLSELTDELDSRFHAVFMERHLQWSCRIDPGVDSCFGDRALLHVALSNLVSNAIRFTPDNGKISLQITRRPGLVHFEIQDTGIGIPEEHLSLIFEKFYEVGDVMKHSSGTYAFKSAGLGLGLATVKAILTAHGASVHVHSVVERGSTFSFSLPIDKLNKD